MADLVPIEIPASGIHAQRPFNNWPDAAVQQRAGTWMKFIDNVQALAEAKSVNPQLNTVLRHFDGGWQQFDFPDHAARRAHVRAYLESFIDGTFFNYAHAITAIEGWNEYNAASHDEAERQKRVEIVRAFCEEWADFKEREPALEKIRLVVGNVAIGNDFPLEAARIVQQFNQGDAYGPVVGYHTYVPFRKPVPGSTVMLSPAGTLPVYEAVHASMRDNHDPYPLKITHVTMPFALADVTPEIFPLGVMENEWPYLSGRWTEMDARFMAENIEVEWLATEAGPIGYYDWGGLDPMGGWRHPDVCDSDLSLYLQVLDYWTVRAIQWNVHNDNRMLGQVLYNSGGTSEWHYFETNTEQHIQIAHLMNTYTAVEPDPDPDPEPDPDPRRYAKKAHLVKGSWPKDKLRAVQDLAYDRGESVFFSADDWALPSRNTDLVIVTRKDLITWNIAEILPNEDAPEPAIENWVRYYFPEPVSTFTHRLVEELFVADIWASPVGTIAQRLDGEVWPVGWSDANPFLNRYELSGLFYYHNAADLNLNSPVWDMDRNKPVYAAAPGKVIYAGVPSVAWQGVVIIEHTMPDMTTVWTRYAHLQPDELVIVAGRLVKCGEMLGLTGRNMTSSGPGPFHLHFEVVRTDIVVNNPGYWPPANNRQIVVDNWWDPKVWLQAHV